MSGNEQVLSGKVAVVTGAGRGIGRGVALEFARQGCSVVVADIGGSLEGGGTNDQLAQEVVDEIVGAGGSAVATATDVTDPASVAEMVGVGVDRFGDIDILINNAGVLRPNWSWDMSHADFSAVVSVHLIGQFNCIRAIVPLMRERGYGRIVNMTSMGALGYPLQAAYSASKAGVIGLTYATAIELDGTGITVNAFGPAGLTRMASAAATMSDEELRAAPVPNAPFVAFLASEAAAGINGQVFMADAGSPGTFHLYAGPVPVASLERDDDTVWNAGELASAVDRAFGDSYATPGGLPRVHLEAYAAKMTALRGLPNYWGAA